MAGQFDFQQSSSPLLAALTEAPERKRQAELQQKQSQQDRLNSLLNNMQQFANIGRTIQQGQQAALQQKQAQSQLQGQQNVQGILAEPQQQAPVSSFGFGPSQMPPTFGQTQQGGTQPQRLQSALAQGFPDQAGQLLAKQQFPDEESLALKKMRQQSLGLDIQNKQQNLDPNSVSAKALRDQIKGTYGVSLDENIPIATATKIGTMLANGQRAEAMKTMADARVGQLELSKQKMLQGSTHVGAAKIEDQKVNQALHLRTLINQRYDEATGTYNIPKAFYTEIALGLARLQSPTGQIGVQLEKDIKQATAKEDLATAYTYITGEPVSGPPQDVIKLFVDSIDRQGQTSEDNRNTYVQNAKDLMGDSIDPRLHRINLGNSFKSALEKSPDQSKKSSGGVPSVGGSFNGEKVLSVKRIK